MTKSSSASPVMPSASVAQVGPAEVLRERRLVVVAEEFELLLAVVEDLEEEHPAELLEALGVAVGAGVLAHDVLDGFDEVGDVGHGSGGFLIERGFEFADGGEVLLLAAEELDDFDRCAERGERIDLEDFQRLDARDAAVGVLVEQSVRARRGPSRRTWRRRCAS